MKVYGGDSRFVLASPVNRVRLGELYLYETETEKVLLKVVGFQYLSNVDEQFLAEITKEDEFAKPFRLTYTGSPVTLVAALKPLTMISGIKTTTVRVPIAPGSTLRPVEVRDFTFLSDRSGMYLGNVRSGDRTIAAQVRLDPKKVLTTHILVAATTGRGKSNFLKVLLWSLMDAPSVGIVVMDAHREYYEVLKEHPKSLERLVSYSTRPKGGERKLVVSTALVKPHHITGAIKLTDAQEREAYLLSRGVKGRPDRLLGRRADYSQTETAYGDDWIEALLTEEAITATDNVNAQMSRATLSRKLRRLLDVESNNSVFRMPSQVAPGESEGLNFTKEVRTALDDHKVVLVDTSMVGSDGEILLGNLITDSMLDFRISMKQLGEKLEPVAVVLEEAPRVLGRDSPPNAYTRVAREGRKFGVGLIAISQLISIIPDEILANMNTKVYMGMASDRERKAAIQNALNDMEGEEDELLRLDVGDAILSSTTFGFAIPIHIPPIEEIAHAFTQKEFATGRKLIED
jgi:hypothetical protein